MTLREVYIKSKDTNGFFHKWGIVKELMPNQKFVSVTKAIVELTNGDIINCDVEDIKFLN